MQLQACEQRSCLSLLPVDCQEKVRLGGGVEQLSLGKKKYKSNRLADSSQFGGEMNPPFFFPEDITWREKATGKERERDKVEAEMRTLGLIETHGRRRIT